VTAKRIKRLKIHFNKRFINLNLDAERISEFISSIFEMFYYLLLLLFIITKNKIIKGILHVNSNIEGNVLT